MNDTKVLRPNAVEALAWFRGHCVRLVRPKLLDLI